MNLTSHAQIQRILGVGDTLLSVCPLGFNLQFGFLTLAHG